MAKSMRCKRVKRLRAIRREIVEKESFTLSREDAKSAAIAAALAAPKLEVRQPPASPFMEIATPSSETASASATNANDSGMFLINSDNILAFEIHQNHSFLVEIL